MESLTRERVLPNNANTAVLPSYTRLDVAAFYEFSADYRVQINIENATDELYFPYAHSASGHRGAPLTCQVVSAGVSDRVFLIGKVASLERPAHSLSPTSKAYGSCGSAANQPAPELKKRLRRRSRLSRFIPMDDFFCPAVFQQLP